MPRTAIADETKGDMIFDKFCGVAERFIPEVEDALRKARLFVFEKPAHEITQAFEPEKAKWLQENFFLPFPVVAVEDPGSCLLYQDLEIGSRGMAVPRPFIECMSLHADPAAFRDGKSFVGKADGLPDGMVSVAAGWIMMEQSDLGKSFKITGSLEWVVVADKRHLAGRKSHDEIQEFVRKATLRNASAGLQELMLLNTPDRFVVEISPAKCGRVGGKDVKIPRSADRPHYTILKPDEIRNVMRIPADIPGERGSPRPHERRAHTRTLRSDHYKQAQGKTIFIPATWVGPSESAHSGKRYKVMLEV